MADSARLIQSLLHPEAYPHPVTRIELCETHISWVLLTGPFAYKIKKPVNFGFVDFSTLERRRFFCEEELRLNRRLAPQLYEAVVPITGTPEQPILDGRGEPLEFAVRMKQFSQEGLLSHLLERGELLPSHIDELARKVAEFHARIAVADSNSPFGTPERVRQPVRENFRHLLATNDALREQIRHLDAWCAQEFARREADFARRKESGCVRECHGDMHLGNMVLLDGAVTVFDGIEFNEAFRWIDVLSEVAFTAMDLRDRGRADLSARFLNASLEHTGDYAGLSVLRYYLVYRAMVRAKVAALRLRQEDQPRLREEYRGYLDLAEWYTQPPTPKLLITHGLSGSGKTTGTQALVEADGAVRLRSDVERKRLFGLDPSVHEPRRAGELYSAAATERTYARLAELAEAVIHAGFNVVVDATFLKRAQREQFRRLAERLRVPFQILDFPADEATLRKRLLQRKRQGGDASDATLAVLERQLRTQEPLSPDEISD